MTITNTLMSPFWTIGVDPGLKGAAVLLNPDGWPHRVEVLPTVKIFGQARTYIQSYENLLGHDPFEHSTHFFIEMVQNYGRESSKKSLLSSGIGWGFLVHPAMSDPWIASVTAMGPKDWQKVMLKGVPGDDTKEKSRNKVEQLWPGLTLWPRVSKGADEGKIRDGVADAALIAAWGRDKILKGDTK